MKMTYSSIFLESLAKISLGSLM